MNLKKDLEVVDLKIPEESLEGICARLEITEPATKQFIRFQLANAILFDRKQSDYGSRNISDFGFYGVIVRMNDKFRRVVNLFNKKRAARVNESIEDNIRDTANYSVIALMLSVGRWPQQ